MLNSENVVRISKKNLLASLYEKLYCHSGIMAISDGDDMIIPGDRFHEFIHDLGLLVEEALKESMSLDK